MALRAVPEHPKFAQLKMKLGLRKWQAMGLLEMLWHFTGKYAMRGNIGKFSDEEIAAWVEWEGDVTVLIDALVACRWIDRSAEHRLVVHDWHEHADATTKKQLGRTKEGFVSDMSRHVSTNAGHVMDCLRPPAPAPAPAPEPEPEPGADALIEKIALAHPQAISQRWTALNIPRNVLEAVITASASVPFAEILAKTQAIAAEVGKWPPGDRTFVSSPEKFFRELQFNRPIEQWRKTNGPVPGKPVNAASKLVQ